MYFSLFIGQCFKTFNKSVKQNGCLLEFLTARLHECKTKISLLTSIRQKGLSTSTSTMKMPPKDGLLKYDLWSYLNRSFVNYARCNIIFFKNNIFYQFIKVFRHPNYILILIDHSTREGGGRTVYIWVCLGVGVPSHIFDNFLM